MSLSRYIQQKKDYQGHPEGEAPSMDYNIQSVMTWKDKIPRDHLKTCAASNYGVTMKVNAYKLAKKYNKRRGEILLRDISTCYGNISYNILYFSRLKNN